MPYTAKFFDTDRFDTKKLIFVGEEVPTVEEFKMIDLEDVTYDDHIVFSQERYLPEENGFLLTKNQHASWSGVHSALCHYFENLLPGTKVIF